MIQYSVKGRVYADFCEPQVPVRVIGERRPEDARRNLTVPTARYHCDMTPKDQIVEAMRTAIQAEQRPAESFDPSEAVPADEMAAELREILAQRWPGK